MNQNICFHKNNNIKKNAIRYTYIEKLLNNCRQIK